MLDTHARKYVEPLIAVAARFFVARGFSANAVTWIAFLVGVTSGVWVFCGWTLFALFTLWLSGFLDAVDGSVARQTGSSSPWGTVLDVTFDRVVELSIIVGLALRFPEHIFLLLCLTGTIVVGMTIFLTVGAVTEKSGVKSFYYQAGLGERTEGFLLFSAMIAFPGALAPVTLIFIGVMVITMVQRLVEARRILKS